MSERNTDPNAAIENLIEVMRHKTGQGCKLRALLYSLWNGKPASLLDIVCLDHEIRWDLVVVLHTFGEPDFFYDEIKRPLCKADLFDWFVAESEVKQ